MTRTRALPLLLATAVALALALVAGALTGPAHAAPLPKVRGFKAAQAVGATPLPQGVIQLSWGQVRRAKSYQVRWARNAQFRQAKSRLVATPRTRLRGLAIGKRHWIAVRAVRGTQRGPWSRIIATVPRAKRPGPFPAGSVRSTPVNGGVQVSWGRSVNATRYRVKAGPYGGASSVNSRWLPASARSFVARGREVDLTTAAFGNPLVTNVEAGNAFAPQTSRRGPQWHTRLPGAPAPAAAGVGVTVGTYNILCDGCGGARPWNQRSREIAQRMKDAKIDVAVLQEVQNDTGAGQLYTRFVQTVAPVLGGSWALNSDASYGGGVEGSRILYDADKFTQVATGTLRVRNRRDPGHTNVPWSLLRTTAAPRVEFLVMSLHLGHGKAATDLDGLRTLGEDVAGLDERIETLRKRHATGGRLPAAILGGDLYSNQAAERKRAVGPVRALVGAGWWDSRQTRSRTTAGFSSTNKFRAQKPHKSGFGDRVDYLFSKGIGTKTRAYGVHPERTAGAPSDHNLVWATFALPTG